MSKVSLEEGVLPCWVFSIEGSPVVKVRKGVGTKAFITELLQQAKLQSDESVLDFVLFRLARSYALKLLSRQAYHSQTLQRKLKQAGFSLMACEKALCFLQEKGYLDDESFLAGRVKSWTSSGKSKRDIAFRLQKMGVRTFASIHEDESLSICLNKKYPKWPELLQDRKSKAKLVAALMRRGFSYEVIFSYFAKNVDNLACLEDD